MKDGLLLSGGLDSIAIAYWKKPEVAFTVDYGQIPAKAEINSARIICEKLSITHHVIDANLRHLGVGDLAGKDSIKLSPVPEWWPFRNQLLVTLVGMVALECNVTNLILGTVKSDSCHADGSEKFIKCLSELMHMQEGNISLDSPAIELNSSELIKKSNIPLSLLAWSHSCHKSNYACGQCRGCIKHKHVTMELGLDVF